MGNGNSANLATAKASKTENEVRGTLLTGGDMAPWNTSSLEEPEKPSHEKETMPDLSKN